VRIRLVNNKFNYAHTRTLKVAKQNLSSGGFPSFLYPRIKDELSIWLREIIGEPRSSAARKAWTQQISDKPNNVQAWTRAHARSRHNRCSLWRFDWTLIKHSLSAAAAAANIPCWKVGRDRRYWFRECYRRKSGEHFGAQTVAVIYRSAQREGGISRRSVSQELITPLPPLRHTLSPDLTCPLFTLSLSSLQFHGFPCICRSRGELLNANPRVPRGRKTLRVRPHARDT